ncbi:short transient receptor potential channel 2-like, partial [Alligator mississippiensis]|uniref:short transient receptor potential channel 2-like n=1 Tax=Alligator mississippiensis TaxID=8496 RepID=UPI00287764AF
TAGSPLTRPALLPQQQPNWREIINRKLKFPRGLLSAIQDGNLPMVQQLLQVGDGILRQLDETEDRAWWEALNLAIRAGGEEVAKALLRYVKFDFRQVHEALLVAVDTNQPHVVKLLLDRLNQEKGLKMDLKSFSLAFFDNTIDASRFAPSVTPLTLACEKDLYEIVDMLTQKGHTISHPHRVSCPCLECTNAHQYDLLKFSLSRINTYKGLASRAYLSVASEDAMLAAFKLSHELKRLSRKEPEFKPEYLRLEQLSQEFAFELLGMCRNQSEVAAVLNDLGDSSEEEDLGSQAFEEGIPNLARLRLAVHYDQKRFVTHPTCQQVLSSIWCGNLSGWRGSNTLWKLFVSCSIFLTMPILCLLYWVAPKSRVGKMLKIPVIKFLLHSASYLWFLVFLLLESVVLERKHKDFLGRSQTLWGNSWHMIWVAGWIPPAPLMSQCPPPATTPHVTLLIYYQHARQNRLPNARAMLSDPGKGDDADVEWKFARSKLYLSYFREGLTLPVPFNVIPTPKSLFYMVRGIFQFICCCKAKKQQDCPSIPTIVSVPHNTAAGRSCIGRVAVGRSHVGCEAVLRGWMNGKQHRSLVPV